LRKKGDDMAAKLALPLALRPFPRLALHPVRLATALALIYLVLAGGYIVYSSRIAAKIAPTLMDLERIDIETYRQARLAEGGEAGFRAAVIADLERRRDLYCPATPETAAGIPPKDLD